MILVKQAGVYVNILNCRLKKYLAEVFKKNNVNLTAEQYLVMDTLWNEGTLTQQAIAFIIQKDKNSVTQFIDNLERKGLGGQGSPPCEQYCCDQRRHGAQGFHQTIGYRYDEQGT